LSVIVAFHLLSFGKTFIPDYRHALYRNASSFLSLRANVVMLIFISKLIGRYLMAKGKGGAPAAKGNNSDRQNGKAAKKHPKVFDPIKRRLVAKD
jgi:hypothetical protein